MHCDYIICQPSRSHLLVLPGFFFLELPRSLSSSSSHSVLLHLPSSSPFTHLLHLSSSSFSPAFLHPLTPPPLTSFILYPPTSLSSSLPALLFLRSLLMHSHLPFSSTPPFPPSSHPFHCILYYSPILLVVTPPSFLPPFPPPSSSTLCSIRSIFQRCPTVVCREHVGRCISCSSCFVQVNLDSKSDSTEQLSRRSSKSNNP